MRTKQSLTIGFYGIVGTGLLIAEICCNKVNPVSNNNINSTGTMTDIEGNIYQTIRIGNQVWMAENLRTTMYNDGTLIPYATDFTSNIDTTPGYCYYNNTNDADSIKKFGALYNWHVLNSKKIAPSGWHVPDTTEWNTLEKYLIANGYNWDGTTTGNKIAKSMATKTDWHSDTTAGTIGCDLTKNNKSGYSAVPGGYKSQSFNDIGTGGYWWCANGLDLYNSADCGLNYDNGIFQAGGNWKYFCFSVRLIKD